MVGACPVRSSLVPSRPPRQGGQVVREYDVEGPPGQAVHHSRIDAVLMLTRVPGRRPGGPELMTLARYSDDTGRPGWRIVPAGQYQVMTSTASRPAFTAGSASASRRASCSEPVR